MKVRNNNRTVIKELARAYYLGNKRKNRILTAAAAMAVFLLYAAFSIAYGKIRADYLIDVRGMGTVASVSLENGSRRQYEAMRKLSYLEDVGVKKNAGTGRYEGTETTAGDGENSGTPGGAWEGNLVFLDETAYEKLMLPAYTDVAGHYPRQADEIMFPVRILEQMGITEPETGMEITLQVETEGVSIPGGEQGDTACDIHMEFTLSGYYTDYIDASVSEPEAYISEAFLEREGIAIFPADRIMASSGVSEDGRSVESRVYTDVPMEYESQQAFGENPMARQSVEGVFGSVTIAGGCGIVVVLCMFLLIFNVIAVSLGRDIRQYGMLKVLGATNRQLKQVVYRQNMKNALQGSAIGAVFAAAAVKLFLSRVLAGLFLEGLGPSDVDGFYPVFLFLAAGSVLAVSWLAGSLAVRRVIRWEPVDSIRYVEADVPRKKQTVSSEEGTGMTGLAWRNVTRSRKRLAVSILSLAVGGVTALGAAVITRGVDITNRLEQDPDFQLGILSGIARFPELVPEKINDDTPVLPPEILDDVLQMDGVVPESVKVTAGSYALIDLSADEALAPKRKSLENPEKTLDFATLQVVGKEEAESLAQYISEYGKEYGLSVDTETFLDGRGCILLHHRELSRELEIQAGKTVDMPVHFYSLEAYGQGKTSESAGSAASGEKEEKGSLLCSGYLDMTAKHFPVLQTTSVGNNISYFIMTEKAFASLGFPEKYFDLSFDVSERERTRVNQSLTQVIQKANRESGIMDTFYLTAGYELLEAEQNRIRTANTLLGGLSILLTAIGIMNFANTLAAGFAFRRRELAVMESIGMTRGQMRRMLLMEGAYYWGIVMCVLLTVGSVSAWLLGEAVRMKLAYFRFFYPWQTMLALAAGMVAVCFVCVWNVYRADRERSTAEKLRQNVY